MKKSKIIVAITISAFFIGCNFYSDKYLGSHYWFWEDGDQSEIVFGESGTQGSFTIIDANVSEYNYDDNFIVAKSNSLKSNGMVAYWIIDKRIKIIKDTSLNAKLFERELKKALVGPLSKDSFELLIQNRQINLSLKPVK